MSLGTPGSQWPYRGCLMAHYEQYSTLPQTGGHVTDNTPRVVGVYRPNMIN